MANPANPASLPFAPEPRAGTEMAPAAATATADSSAAFSRRDFALHADPRCFRAKRIFLVARLARLRVRAGEAARRPFVYGGTAVLQVPCAPPPTSFALANCSGSGAPKSSSDDYCVFTTTAILHFLAGRAAAASVLRAGGNACSLVAEAEVRSLLDEITRRVDVPLALYVRALDPDNLDSVPTAAPRALREVVSELRDVVGERVGSRASSGASTPAVSGEARWLVSASGAVSLADVSLLCVLAALRDREGGLEQVRRAFPELLRWAASAGPAIDAMVADADAEVGKNVAQDEIDVERRWVQGWDVV